MITLPRAKEISAVAAALATTMATSEALTEAFNEGIRINKENKITVQNIHFSLFGEPDGAEGLFSADDVATWPRVGSEEGKTGNLPFDKFKYKNSEGKEESASFFRRCAEAHPIGASILLKRDAVSNREKVQNEYTAMSQADADKVKDGLNDDFTAFLSKFKIAVAAYQMMVQVTEELEGIVIVNYAMRPVYDEKTKRPKIGADKKMVLELDRSSPQIIEVTDATNNKAGKYFTMTNFARLSPQICLAGEANYGAFITSNRRPNDSDEEESKDEGIKVTTPKQFEDGTIAFNHFLNAVKADPARLRELVKYYTIDSPDDRIATLAGLVDDLTILTGHKEVAKKIDAYNLGTQQKKAA